VVFGQIVCFCPPPYKICPTLEKKIADAHEKIFYYFQQRGWGWARATSFGRP